MADAYSSSVVFEMAKTLLELEAAASTDLLNPLDTGSPVSATRSRCFCLS